MVWARLETQIDSAARLMKICSEHAEKQAAQYRDASQCLHTAAQNSQFVRLTPGPSPHPLPTLPLHVFRAHAFHPSTRPILTAEKGGINVIWCIHESE